MPWLLELRPDCDVLPHDLSKTFREASEANEPLADVAVQGDILEGMKCSEMSGSADTVCISTQTGHRFIHVSERYSLGPLRLSDSE